MWNFLITHSPCLKVGSYCSFCQPLFRCITTAPTFWIEHCTQVAYHLLGAIWFQCFIPNLRIRQSLWNINATKDLVATKRNKKGLKNITCKPTIHVKTHCETWVMIGTHEVSTAWSPNIFSISSLHVQCI